MMEHNLKNLKNWGETQARIGLLEPITAQDTLALAWAKAAMMAELGASSSALQCEIARVMEPHATGSGEVGRYEFEDADKISLQAMAQALDGRQARQLAQDVGLAAQALAWPELDAGRDSGAAKGRSWGKASLISGLGAGAWLDPLASSFQTQTRADAPGRSAARWERDRQSGRAASFACARLRFTRPLA